MFFLSCNDEKLIKPNIYFVIPEYKNLVFIITSWIVMKTKLKHLIEKV